MGCSQMFTAHLNPLLPPRTAPPPGSASASDLTNQRPGRGSAADNPSGGSSGEVTFYCANGGGRRSRYVRFPVLEGDKVIKEVDSGGQVILYRLQVLRTNTDSGKV